MYYYLEHNKSLKHNSCTETSFTTKLNDFEQVEKQDRNWQNIVFYYYYWDLVVTSNENHQIKPI